MSETGPTRGRTPADRGGPGSPPPGPGYPQPGSGPHSGRDAEAREHMRRVPDHEMTVGSDDDWHCLTCEEER